MPARSTEVDRHRDPIRSASVLLGAGGLITAIGLVLPHPSQVDAGGLVFLSIAATAVGLALWFLHLRIPDRVFPVIGLLATIFVSLGLFFNGERHGGAVGGDEMYYLWVVLWAAYYFSRKALAVQVLLVMVAYGVTLNAIHPGSIGTSRWISLTGLVIGAAVVVRLLSERIDGLIAELRTSADSDPLTGLANRRGLTVAYGREIAQHERTGRPFALLVADLDRFKQINDELGHKAGDRALVELADLLRNQIRAVDTPARIGGDEFAVLLSDADAALAACVAERIAAAVAQHADLAHWPGGISIGLAVSDADGVGMDDLLRHADSRLYLKKRAVHAREELEAA
jgi:diguanylate cyclase (GGDEF)-like protein